MKICKIGLKKIIKDLGLNTFENTEILDPYELISMTRIIYGFGKVGVFLSEDKTIDKVHKRTMGKILSKVEFLIESGIGENTDAIRECADCLNYICTLVLSLKSKALQD